MQTAFENFNAATGSEATRVDLWLMLGDNAYNTGTESEYQAAVFSQFPEFLRKAPVWPTIGNHETSDPGENVNPNPLETNAYLDIFDLPTAAESGWGRIGH